ncbi:MAG: DHHA1 domain-containing protein [Nevskiales bacterium]
MPAPLCIYHAHCADGFAAAYAVWKAYGDEAEYLPAKHTDAPPDCRNRDVIIVDFSYNREDTTHLLGEANSVIHLDHHRTAERQLEGLQAEHYSQVFNNEHSGAVLAWQHFHAETPIPQLLLYVEDIDLRRYQLPRTWEIEACIFSHPYNFQVWDALAHASVEELAREGVAIKRKFRRDLDELLPVLTQRATIAGHDVPVANLPYNYAPTAASRLAAGEAFAACFWFTPEHVVFSLRSDENGVDVSSVAEQYGGGGHQHAAGFRVSREQAMQMGI